jgi:hypothetical protein
MNDQDQLAERFEQHRNRLRAVAYRMLGSRSEAEDAVQESWLRLSGADHDIASRAMYFEQLTYAARPVLVNGAPGAVVFLGEKSYSVLGFTVSGGRIAEMNILSDPLRLQALNLAFVDVA